MLWSELAISTLREPIHPLLVRAAYKRGSEWLLLGKRSLEKIERIMRQIPDMNRVLQECGIQYIASECGFVAETDSGNDILVRGNDYAALLECAVTIPQAPKAVDPPEDASPAEFSTPGVKTIAQIAQFTSLPETSQMKSLVMVADGKPVMVLLRGDHQMNERKLAKELGAASVRQATLEELRNWLAADAGSLGPVGVTGMRIIADNALRGRRNMIAGANKNDYHLRNVTPERDFAVEFFDLRMAAEGDTSVLDRSPLRFTKARRLDSPEATLTTAAEQNQDADGLLLPPSIAPFTVIVTPVHPSQLEAAREIYQRLLSQGFDALLDDRDARPGVKFKDADLIGIPYRVNIGKKFGEGLVEFVDRRAHRTSDIPAAEVNIPR